MHLSDCIQGSQARELNLVACIMIDEHNYFMVFYYLNFYEVPSKSSVSFPIKGKKKLPSFKAVFWLNIYILSILYYIWWPT